MTAACRGVSPLTSLASREAPREASASIADVRPAKAARCRGVLPITSLELTSTDLNWRPNTWMAASHPFMAATCSGVKPERFLASTLEPSLTKALITRTRLAAAAMCSGVLPLVHRAFRSAPSRTRTLTASVLPKPAAQ